MPTAAIDGRKIQATYIVRLLTQLQFTLFQPLAAEYYNGSIFIHCNSDWVLFAFRRCHGLRCRKCPAAFARSSDAHAAYSSSSYIGICNTCQSARKHNRSLKVVTIREQFARLFQPSRQHWRQLSGRHGVVFVPRLPDGPGCQPTPRQNHHGLPAGDRRRCDCSIDHAR